MTIGYADSASPYASEHYFHQLLGKAIAARARDIHLKVGQPPGARVGGELVYFRLDPIRAIDTDAVAHHVIRNPEVLRALPELREFDTSYEAPGVGRFRV